MAFVCTTYMPAVFEVESSVYTQYWITPREIAGQQVLYNSQIIICLIVV